MLIILDVFMFNKRQLFRGHNFQNVQRLRKIQNVLLLKMIYSETVNIYYYIRNRYALSNFNLIFKTF